VDALAQVSQQLLQGLLSMGLQNDPKAREMAQGLLASIAAQQTASTSVAQAPLQQAPFIPPLHLPTQPHEAQQGQHRRQQSSVSFADSVEWAQAPFHPPSLASVRAPPSGAATNELMRERSLAQAQQLLTSRPKAVSGAPVELRRRRGQDSAVDAAFSPTPVASAEELREQLAELSLLRMAALRRLRTQLRQADAAHAEQVTSLWADLRATQANHDAAWRQLEEEALYKLYVQARDEGRAALGEDRVPQNASIDASMETDEAVQAELLAQVAQLKIDSSSFSLHASVRPLAHRIGLLRARMVFAGLSHAAARRRLLQGSVASVAHDGVLQRAKAAFGQWRVMSLREREVSKYGGIKGQRRRIPTHAQAKEHMDLLRQTQCVRKLHRMASKSSLMRSRLASLLSSRAARLSAALWHSWRVAVLELYQSRLCDQMALSFRARMRRARDFREWRLRASRDRFVAWQLERAMEERLMQEDAQQQQQQQLQLTNVSMLAAAPSTAATKPAVSLSRRETAASLAKHRHVQELLKQRKAQAAPSKKKKTTRKVIATAPTAAAGAAPTSVSAAATTAAKPSVAPASLAELDELEAQAPALCKYFLHEVRREIIADAAAAGDSKGAVPPLTVSAAISAALRRSSGSVPALVLADPSLWIPVLAHSFRAHSVAHQLAQVRWIRAQLSLRRAQEAPTGWLVSKFVVQAREKEAEDSSALARRKAESARLLAIRGVMKEPMTTTTGTPSSTEAVAAELARMPYVVPVPEVQFIDAAPDVTNVVERARAPLPPPRNSSPMPLPPREASPAAVASPPRMPSPIPVPPAIEKEKEEDESAPTEAELEALQRELVQRERIAAEVAWIEERLSRGLAAASAAAATGDGDVSRGLDDTAASQKSVADWLREFDLPDPEAEERRLQALEEKDEEEQELQEEHEDEEEPSRFDGAESSRFTDRNSRRSFHSAATTSSSLQRPREVGIQQHLSLDEQHHLHVHHFPPELAQLVPGGSATKASSVAPPAAAPLAAEPPSSSSAELLHELRSINHSIEDIQHSLSASFQRRRERDMERSREFQPEETPSRDVPRSTSGVQPVSAAAVASSSLVSPVPSSVRWAQPLQHTRFVSPAAAMASPGDLSASTDYEDESIESEANDDPPHLRRQANLFWARTTHSKVFRAWLTRVLLQHLERRAARQQAALDGSAASSAAAADPELSAALSERSEVTAAADALAGASSLDSPATSFHASSRSGRAVAMSPAQLRPTYPELLRGEVVKRQLEQSILAAEQAAEAEREALARAAGFSADEPRQLISALTDESILASSEHGDAAVASAVEPSLDELMFERFRKSTDRKVQKQLERMLLKTAPPASASAASASTAAATSTTAAAPTSGAPQRIVAVTQRSGNAIAVVQQSAPLPRPSIAFAGPKSGVSPWPPSEPGADTTSSSANGSAASTLSLSSAIQELSAITFNSSASTLRADQSAELYDRNTAAGEPAAVAQVLSVEHAALRPPAYKPLPRLAFNFGRFTAAPRP
jgi:hypothetical protein